MKRRESEFQTRLNRWSKHFWKTLPRDEFGSALVECKVSKTKSLAYSAVSDKQVRNLTLANEGFFNHTFSDFDRMGTPADCVFLHESNAFVAIQFWRPRNKEFFLIPIQEWITEVETSDRKSLTECRARDIGHKFTF